MGLVEDHRACGRQHACICRCARLQPDRHVGEEQVVVHDDDVRLQRFAPHRGDEAAFPVGTGLPQAGLAAGVELGPERGVFGQRIDLRAVAGCGGLLPLRNGVELRDLFEPGEQRGIAQRVELVLAQVVGAALHVADLERPEDAFEEGDILEEELLLEVLGARGNDHPLLPVQGQAQGGQEIGQRLAGPGTRFDDEVALVGEGLLDGLGHLVLPFAMLVGERGAGENAAWREEVVEAGQLG